MNYGGVSWSRFCQLPQNNNARPLSPSFNSFPQLGLNNNHNPGTFGEASLAGATTSTPLQTISARLTAHSSSFHCCFPPWTLAFVSPPFCNNLPYSSIRSNSPTTAWDPTTPMDCSPGRVLPSRHFPRYVFLRPLIPPAASP